MKINNKTKVLYIIPLLLIVGIVIFFLLNPFYTNEDSDFIEMVNNKAISANILIINATEDSGSVTYSTGQSGVIYKQENGKYYALTALHGMPSEDEKSTTKLIVLGYTQPTYADYLEAGGHYEGLSTYYTQFPEAVIEYYDEAYDLAVISFQSENEYAVLSISSKPPIYKEPVVAMGNPHNGNRNTITTGRITSKKPVPFGDEAGENQHYIIRHSAKSSIGFSGGALINKDMDIVGIHLGGGENLFGMFVNGNAMPCDKILDFLREMNNH